MLVGMLVGALVEATHTRHVDTIGIATVRETHEHVSHMHGFSFVQVIGPLHGKASCVHVLPKHTPTVVQSIDVTISPSSSGHTMSSHASVGSGVGVGVIVGAGVGGAQSAIRLAVNGIAW
jgi:hypothetical protein